VYFWEQKLILYAHPLFSITLIKNDHPYIYLKPWVPSYPFAIHAIYIHTNFTQLHKNEIYQQ
jgi:hypothetical protein